MKTFTRFLDEARLADFTDYEFGLKISNASFDSAGRLTTFRAQSVIDGKLVSNVQWDRVATSIASYLGHSTIEKEFRLDPSDKVIFYTEVEQSAMTGQYYVDVNGKRFILPSDFHILFGR